MKFTLIILTLILTSCKKDVTENAILLAEREATVGWNYLRIYKDSTFEFEYRSFPSSNFHRGKFSIIKDTLTFHYSDSIPSFGDKAIIARNQLVYINGQYKEILEILLDSISKNSFKSYYRPKSTFSDFKSEVFTGKLINPDFSTNPDAKRFITTIEEKCSKGINFAGHYTLVIWGCGTACQSGVIVDRKTGKIYDGYHSYLGSSFKKDSRLLVKNVGAIDSITNQINNCPYCEVSHEYWTGTEFQRIKY